VRETIATVLLIAGVAAALLAVAGVVLMRTALDRVHYLAATTTATVLLAAAVLVREGFSLIALKGLLLAGFALFSSPVLAHVTARAIELAERDR